MWGKWGPTRPWSFLVEQNHEGEERGGRRGGMISLRVKIVLRWGTPGTGEWNTRMGLEVPRVRLTWWLTDITVITFSHVKLTAGLWRWQTNNSIFLREIVKLLSLSCPHGLKFNGSHDNSLTISHFVVNIIRDISHPFWWQEPLTTRLQLDVDVAPLELFMEPENNHIEEGGRVSVSCTATQVWPSTQPELVRAS